MAKSILEKGCEAFIAFTKRFGVEPNVIYVGREEFLEIRNSPHANVTYRHLQRADFQGMKVYRVDADSHITCGFVEES